MTETSRQSVQTKRDREIVIHELEEKDNNKATISASSQHSRAVLSQPVKKSVQEEKKPVEKRPVEKKIKPTMKKIPAAYNREDHFWRKTIPFFATIAILALIVFLNVGLFSATALAPIAKPIARFLHYPVALVGTSVITYPELEREQTQIAYFYQGDHQLSGSSIPDDQTILRIAYNKLLKDSILAPEYKKRNISVSADELEAGFVYMFNAPSSDQNAVQIILSFNQTPDEFKNTYLKDFLLQAKLASQLQQDPARIQEKTGLIQSLHSQVVANPALFASIAKNVNGDATASVSGDLGFLSVSQIPAAFSAILSLPVHGISDVIETNDGYYFFEVLETIPENPVDGKLNVMHVRQIVVHKDTATSYANERIAKKRIFFLDPTIEWDAACRQVTASSVGSCSPEFQTNQFSFTSIISSIANAVPNITSHFSPVQP